MSSMSRQYIIALIDVQCGFFAYLSQAIDKTSFLWYSVAIK